MTDFYDVVHEGMPMRLPRVTATLGIIDKSGPLMGWAVNVERAAIRAALEEALTEPGFEISAPDAAHVLWKRMEGSFRGRRASVKAANDAADIGSAIHDIAHWHTKRMLGDEAGPEPTVLCERCRGVRAPEGDCRKKCGAFYVAMPDPVMRGVLAWLDWCRDVEFVPLAAERRVYCPWCAIAGTLDTYGKVQGQLTVVDYKTGKAVYRESHMQIAWYRHLAKREGLDSDGGIILRLPKTAADPNFEAAAARDVPLSALRAVATTWRLVRWMDGDDYGSERMTTCEVK